jgi:hypothetical protein
VVEPAVTVTLEGTFKLENPLLPRVTTIPPAGAAFDSVTAQLLLEFELSVMGLHCNDETATAEARLRFSDREVPLYVAVRLPFWSAETDPVVTVNGPVVDPAVTVTLEGAFKLDNPLLLSVTRAPPLGAAFDSVTVQLLLAFAPSVVGLHCRSESTAADARLRFRVFDVPL